MPSMPPITDRGHRRHLQRHRHHAGHADGWNGGIVSTIASVGNMMVLLLFLFVVVSRGGLHDADEAPQLPGGRLT